MLEISVIRENELVYNYKKPCKKVTYVTFKSLAFFLATIGAEAEKVKIEEIDKGVLETIADFCRTTTKFINDVIWCVNNPIGVLIIILEWFGPLMLCFAAITPIIGLTCLSCNVDKIYKCSPKQLIVSPIIIYLIYLSLITVLKTIA